ncbi:hypothetical protein NLI96_g7353 [Meripilus lineatus]|uniref:Uncharacterized protein n=1 Tax=Meripilus lineatus TaxID=2056292 RepID=A0AAD5UZN0_9APHY|nr:hypothetical protein NLI96_g7353 [Physisporinus lineatus]
MHSRVLQELYLEFIVDGLADDHAILLSALASCENLRDLTLAIRNQDREAAIPNKLALCMESILSSIPASIYSLILRFDVWPFKYASRDSTNEDANPYFPIWRRVDGALSGERFSKLAYVEVGFFFFHLQSIHKPQTPRVSETFFPKLYDRGILWCSPNRAFAPIVGSEDWVLTPPSRSCSAPPLPPLSHEPRYTPSASQSLRYGKLPAAPGPLASPMQAPLPWETLYGPFGGKDATGRRSPMRRSPIIEVGKDHP